jgi:hypothetical protein
MLEAGPYLSVILPCRNQGDHIAAVLMGYRDALEALGRPYELVVVPNACTDDTAAAVERAARQDAQVRVVEQAQGGWGRAVRAGLAAARGELLCYTNSARTVASSIVRLHALYLQHAGCLAKVRREQRSAPLRELGSALFNLEVRLMFGLGSLDVNGTPKLFARGLFERLCLRANGDLLDLELMVQVARLGVPVVEMPVPGFARHGGRSSTTLWSAAKLYAGALALRLSG